MKTVTIIFSFLLAQYSFGTTKNDCVDGNFAACKEIFNHYGSTTDQNGAADFFASACASQNLKITCEVISTDKSETLKKILEVAGMNSAVFVINGTKVDKIYKISAAR